MRKTIYFIYTLFIVLLSCKSVNSYSTLTKPFGNKPKIIRQPYLQMVTPTTAIIRWKTDSTSLNCQVVLKNIESNEKHIKKGKLLKHEGNIFNEVKFDNLNPKTKYNYYIYSNGHLLAGGKDYFIITNPDNKISEINFFALGDIGAKEKQSFAATSANAILNLENRPDFGLGLGDIVYPKGESKNYDNHLFKPFQDVFKNIPFYPVAGNHDWLSDPEKNFEIEWALPNNEHYYSFSYSNTLFIGLDSSDGDFYDYENQIKWLKKTLLKNKEIYDWIIVYLHHNGKSCTYKQDYSHVIDLYDIFADNNVDIVLNGHAHTYERLKPYDKKGNIDTFLKTHNSYIKLKNKFISITIGAGGKINKKWSPNPNDKKNCLDGNIVAHSEHVASFGVFSIKGKKLMFRAVNSFTGEVFDEFSIVK